MRHEARTLRKAAGGEAERPAILQQSNMHRHDDRTAEAMRDSRSIDPNTRVMRSYRSKPSLQCEKSSSKCRYNGLLRHVLPPLTVQFRTNFFRLLKRCSRGGARGCKAMGMLVASVLLLLSRFWSEASLSSIAKVVSEKERSETCA